MKRRIFPTLLALALSLTMVACGEKDVRDNTTGNNGDTVGGAYGSESDTDSRTSRRTRESDYDRMLRHGRVTDTDGDLGNDW